MKPLLTLILATLLGVVSTFITSYIIPFEKEEIFYLSFLIGSLFLLSLFFFLLFQKKDISFNSYLFFTFSKLILVIGFMGGYLFLLTPVNKVSVLFLSALFYIFSKFFEISLSKKKNTPPSQQK